MTCYLPSEDGVSDYLMSGYSVFLHFGESLGRRIEEILPPKWGEGWYQRLFPAAPSGQLQDDHFDPDAVLRGIVSSDPERGLPEADRTDLEIALFPGMRTTDLRALRRYRGAYAHYDGVLATVGMVRDQLRDALALLARVATESWRDGELAELIHSVDGRVERLAHGISVGDEKGASRPLPVAPRRSSGPWLVDLAGIVAVDRQRERGQTARFNLRLGDPYPGRIGRRVIRLLRTSDDLWDVGSRSLLSSEYGSEATGALVKDLRGAVVDTALRLDDMDGTLSGQVLGETRYLGRFNAGDRGPEEWGSPWTPDALMLPHTYRIEEDGAVTSLDDPEAVLPSSEAVRDRLAAGFRSARARAGIEASSADCKVSLTGLAIVYFNEQSYLLARVSPDEWFSRHFPAV